MPFGSSVMGNSFSTAVAATPALGVISTDTFCATTEARPPNSSANTFAAWSGPSHQ